MALFGRLVGILVDLARRCKGYSIVQTPTDEPLVLKVNRLQKGTPTVSRYTPRTIDGVRELLGGLAGDMNVDVLPGVPATVAHVLTVDDLRSLAAWPPGLVLIVNTDTMTPALT